MPHSADDLVGSGSLLPRLLLAWSAHSRLGSLDYKSGVHLKQYLSRAKSEKVHLPGNR